MATQKHTKTKQRRSRCALAGGSISAVESAMNSLLDAVRGAYSCAILTDQTPRSQVEDFGNRIATAQRAIESLRKK